MKQALREQLLAEASRRNTDLITKFIEDNPAQLSHLVDIIIQHEELAAAKAAWVLEKITERKVLDIQVVIPKIIAVLNDIPVSGTRRTVAKVLMLVPIPEKEEGYVLDFCLNMIECAKEPVAVKANCMTIVFNLIPKYPELKDEVFAIIENQLVHNSVALGARFNVLKKKHKL